MTLITRFAPSPTGPLHLGHAYSALRAYDLAQSEGGVFLLRIEDIDLSRARPAWEAQIYEDLSWLGVSWPEPVMRQSDRRAAYSDTLDHLWARGLLYPCACRRADIAAAASAPQEGVSLGPDGIVYPGTCRPFTPITGPRPQHIPLRLDMRRACDHAGLQVADDLITFTEKGAGPQGETGRITLPRNMLVHEVGDVILSRRDMATSYHLSVVVDDADQGITDVVRGEDLFEATGIHVILQRLLDLHTPVYRHHPLVRDATGKRLAKRDDARAIHLFRTEGASPAEIRKMVGLAP